MYLIENLTAMTVIDIVMVHCLRISVPSVVIIILI